MQQPTIDQEQALWAAGYARVAGLDEAGRGAWAGPVVAAAVVLPADPSIAPALQGVADSKQLAPAQREALYPLILRLARAVGLGIIPSSQIDALGIAAATRLAMSTALAQISPAPDYLLIDYVRLAQVPMPQLALARGDATVLSIAAASVLAKVTRDRLMADLAAEYPGYGFQRHKGYGTREHQHALRQLGPCVQHRGSFQPVRAWQQGHLWHDQFPHQP
jgi:ribonuclease HII